MCFKFCFGILNITKFIRSLDQITSMRQRNYLMFTQFIFTQLILFDVLTVVYTKVVYFGIKYEVNW